MNSEKRKRNESVGKKVKEMKKKRGQKTKRSISLTHFFGNSLLTLPLLILRFEMTLLFSFPIIVKLSPFVEGDQKAPFSIATTPRCREGRYSFPWIASLYPWYIPYIAECYASTIFKIFGMTWRGIETRSPRPLPLPTTRLCDQQQRINYVNAVWARHCYARGFLKSVSQSVIDLEGFNKQRN